MKSSYWGYLLVILGIFVVAILMLTQSVTTSNTQDYYIVKEVTEAAMVDAIDYGYYREYGELKINKEKFVENFLRRFADSVGLSKTYTVEFYDLYEAPPKVSVQVSSDAGSFTVGTDTTEKSVTNRIDAILEISGEE
ncbi:MAG: hypothetical protein IJ574_05770 [Bacilli bacterium]|nr:hypothetical protein [Bacilli bacterium]